MQERETGKVGCETQKMPLREMGKDGFEIDPACPVPPTVENKGMLWLLYLCSRASTCCSKKRKGKASTNTMRTVEFSNHVAIALLSRLLPYRYVAIGPYDTFYHTVSCLF